MIGRFFYSNNYRDFFILPLLSTFFYILTFFIPVLDQHGGADTSCRSGYGFTVVFYYVRGNRLDCILENWELYLYFLIIFLMLIITIYHYFEIFMPNMIILILFFALIPFFELILLILNITGWRSAGPMTPSTGFITYLIALTLTFVTQLYQRRYILNM